MRHLGAPLLFLLSTLSAPLWLLPFPFPFYAANVYTLNNFLLVVNKPSSVLLALRLRLRPLLLLHFSVLSATLLSSSLSSSSSLVSCGSFFDTLIWLYLICVCVVPFAMAKRAHMRFTWISFALPCPFSMLSLLATPSTCVALYFFLLTRFCCFSQLTHFKNA